MSTAVKLLVAALLLFAIGPPVTETWRALLLATGLIAVVFSEWNSRPARVVVAVVVIASVVLLKTLLPRADIAEGHNAFLVIHDGEAIEKGLPPQIFQNWRRQFDALYPPDREPYADRSQWRKSGVPATLFAQSTDALWRQAKYTRQVDRILFRTLGEFRGGFANDPQFNFWSGELLREQMPFFVMYELTPAAVGSRLAWQGQVFWQRSDGSFEEVVHPQFAARAIVPNDAGKRVYAAFFPKRDAIRFELQPSWMLRASGGFDTLLTLASVAGLVLLTLRPRWPSYVRALALFSAGYAYMLAFLFVSAGKYLGREYPPQGGGDDGLMHDGWGHAMALLAGRGRIDAALEGGEPIYWFTPGARYLRMIEKLIFGDTNLLFALLVPCTLVVLFYLVRHLLGLRWAWGVVALSLLLLVGNLSYLQYIANAKLGYGDAIACALFMLGLVLLLRTEPSWGGNDHSFPEIAIAGAAMAASMFIRPNFAIGVVWMAVMYTLACLHGRAFGRVAALGLGLAFALWMPYHNWHYGHRFYLIARSATEFSLPLGPRDYVNAIADVARGRFDTHETAVTSRQIVGWLFDPGFLVRPQLRPLAWCTQAVKLIALLVTLWVAVSWRPWRDQTPNTLAIIAVAALWMHVPMLFAYTTNYRYAMLGWDLSLIVLIVRVARPFQARAAAAIAAEPVPQYAR